MRLEAGDSRDLVSRYFDYSENPRMIYNVEEHLDLLGNLGVTVGSRFNSSINDSDETPGFESLRLSFIRWILDKPLRFFHLTRTIRNA